MALAALAAAGLVGGGIVVAGQFVSADRPTLDAVGTIDDPEPGAPADEQRDEQADDQADEQRDGLPSIEGEIVIDDGDGDPLVLDLGPLAECLGPILRGGPLFDLDLDLEWDGEWDGEGRPPSPFDEEFHRRMEEFLDDLPPDGLDELDDGARIFGSGGSTITVVGPDGVQVIDLGEGDATVTIEQTDGELTVETEGDATVGELPDLGELLPELDAELDPDVWRDRLPLDPDAIGSCLDDLGDGGSSDGS